LATIPGGVVMRGAKGFCPLHTKNVTLATSYRQPAAARRPTPHATPEGIWKGGRMAARSRGVRGESSNGRVGGFDLGGSDFRRTPQSDSPAGRRSVKPSTVRGGDFRRTLNVDDRPARLPASASRAGGGLGRRVTTSGAPFGQMTHPCLGRTADGIVRSSGKANVAECRRCDLTVPTARPKILAGQPRERRVVDRVTAPGFFGRGFFDFSLSSFLPFFLSPPFSCLERSDHPTELASSLGRCLTALVFWPVGGQWTGSPPDSCWASRPAGGWAASGQGHPPYSCWASRPAGRWVGRRPVDRRGRVSLCAPGAVAGRGLGSVEPIGEGSRMYAGHCLPRTHFCWTP
jgi:hypothetical protein